MGQEEFNFPRLRAWASLKHTPLHGESVGCSHFPRLRAWASLKLPDPDIGLRIRLDFPRLRAWASLKQQRPAQVGKVVLEFPTPSGVGLIEACGSAEAVAGGSGISHAFGRGPH